MKMIFCLFLMLFFACVSPLLYFGLIIFINNTNYYEGFYKFEHSKTFFPCLFDYP